MKKSAQPRLPAVDDHIVAPESRAEILHGHLLMSPPANEPHATHHGALAYVLSAHVADGYSVAIDMLTRTSATSNFAPDASVYPAARDAGTGGRQLEELAFEIADTQPLRSASDKARELIRRGVRRVFCLVVHHARLLEWNVETDGWSPLPGLSHLDDRCFAAPVPVHVITHAAGRDAAVVAALEARGEPALVAIEARGEARGEARALAQALRTILAARGLSATYAQEGWIRAAGVPALTRWIAVAATANTADEVFAAPLSD